MTPLNLIVQIMVPAGDDSDGTGSYLDDNITFLQSGAPVTATVKTRLLAWRGWELWSVGYLPLPQQSPGLAVAAVGVALVLYGAGAGFGVSRRY